MKLRTVLSLFDGISCGQVALQRAGIEFERYFASEIDKYAIQITQKNFPETIQLGDVNNWQEWNIDWNSVDLIIGGSPCQGFSIAGKGLNFNDERSKLFFVYVDILNYIKQINPNVKFLLENVKMKKEFSDAISEILNCKPVEINSALVSAQNRKRLYWTNIGEIQQPEDKEIYLKDILENGFVDREKSLCVTSTYFKGGNLQHYFEKHKRQVVFNSPLQVGIADIKGMDCIKRVYDIRGKAPTLTTCGGGHREPKIAIGGVSWRKLTPIECERLQTLSDNYTEGVSNTQRYKTLGNGWTVDVITHILKYLKQGEKNK